MREGYGNSSAVKRVHEEGIRSRSCTRRRLQLLPYYTATISFWDGKFTLLSVSLMRVIIIFFPRRLFFGSCQAVVMAGPPFFNDVTHVGVFGFNGSTPKEAILFFSKIVCGALKKIVCGALRVVPCWKPRT